MRGGAERRDPCTGYGLSARAFAKELRPLKPLKPREQSRLDAALVVGCVLSREGHVISLDAFWATPHVFHDSAVVRWSRRTRASTRLDLSPTKQALRLRLQQRANAASAFQTPVSKRVSAKHTFNVDSRPHTSIETYVQTSVSKTRERETHVQR